MSCSGQLLFPDTMHSFRRDLATPVVTYLEFIVAVTAPVAEGRVCLCYMSDAIRFEVVAKKYCCRHVYGKVGKIPLAQVIRRYLNVGRVFTKASAELAHRCLIMARQR